MPIEERFKDFYSEYAANIPVYNRTISFEASYKLTLLSNLIDIEDK